jgi:hypothetical protein
MYLPYTPTWQIELKSFFYPRFPLTGRPLLGLNEVVALPAPS